MFESMVALADPSAMVAVSNTVMGWSIDNFLNSTLTTIQKWGGILLVILGAIMIIWSGVQIAKNYLSHGKTQANWGMIIVMLIIGGAMFAGGIASASGLGILGTVSSGSVETIEQLGGSAG